MFCFLFRACSRGNFATLRTCACESGTGGVERFYQCDPFFGSWACSLADATHRAANSTDTHPATPNPKSIHHQTYTDGRFNVRAKIILVRAWTRADTTLFKIIRSYSVDSAQFHLHREKSPGVIRGRVPWHGVQWSNGLPRFDELLARPFCRHVHHLSGVFSLLSIRLSS